MTHKTTIVALGGTGVIGSALRSVARRRGLDMISLSLDPVVSEPGYANIRIDLAALAPGDLVSALTAAVPAQAAVLAVFDIVGLKPQQIPELADFAARCDAAVAQISSCLLYDHDATAPVDETCPLVAAAPAPFPYQSLKLAQERALQSCDRIAWRTIRTGHIIGRGGLLGCVPAANRDPHLLDRLRSGAPLALAAKGRQSLSFIHAADLADAMIALSLDPATAQQVMNVVNPGPTRARDYYDTLADLIGVTRPSVVSYDVDPSDFWSLTARDNVFVSRHPAVRSLIHRHDLRASLADALSVGDAVYPTLGGHLRSRIAGA